MSQKRIYRLVVAVIVVVVVAAVVAAVYLATRSGGGGGAGGASSLQFSVSVTHKGVTRGTYTYMAKNAGTSSMMMRIESTTSSGENITYIVNEAQQKALVHSDGQWQDLSDAFTTQWTT